jgi:hypothetical protein
VAAGLLQAHHSLAGVYDMKREKELSGTMMTLGFGTPLAQRGIGKTGPNALPTGDD